MSAARPTRQERCRARNPLATWGHAATRSAIRRGLIERDVCAVCGDPETDGHHPDHKNPLEVVWLCRRHHKAEHRRLAEGGR
jgi:ribosomal protein L15E